MSPSLTFLYASQTKPAFKASLDKALHIKKAMETFASSDQAVLSALKEAVVV